MGIRIRFNLLVAVLCSVCSAMGSAAPQGQSLRDALPVNAERFDYLRSDNFDIYLEKQTPLDEKTLELLETVYDRYFELMLQQDFDVHNAGAFTWICFNNRRSYQEYARRADSFNANNLNSYYSAKTNYVTLLTEFQDSRRELPDTRVTDTHQISASDFPRQVSQQTQQHNFMPAMITHELIHQLSFNTGLQTRGVEYPLWVSEGIATTFEYLFENPDLNQDNRYRLQTIIRLRDQGSVIPLGFFISMTRLSRPDLTDTETYAQCWAFFDFLWNTRNRQLKDYLAAAGRRSSGTAPPAVLREEFVNAFGPLEPLEADWNKWLCAKTGD